MEWLIMPSNNLRVTASKMGFMKDGAYVIGDECEASLEELLHNLQHEDTVSRSVRREIASSTLVEGDLFPILKAAVNDITISYLAIKVLSNLTLPMAVIMPVKHQMTPQDWEKRRGVQHMESSIRSLCADSQITDILVNHIKNNLEDAGEYPMEKTYVGMVLEIIALIRNVLHADDIRPGSTNGDTIISNLIDSRFDDVVTDLLARDEGVDKIVHIYVMAVWVPNLTQVLGLMFRSQKSSQLVQLIVSPESDSKSEKDGNKVSTDEADKKDVSDNEDRDKLTKDTPKEEGPKLPGVNGYEDDPISNNKTDESKRGETVPRIQVERGSDAEGNPDERVLAVDGYRDQDADGSETSDQKSPLPLEGSSLSEVKSESGSVTSEGLALSPLCDALQNSVQVASGDSSSRSATPTNDMNDNSSTSSESMDSGSSCTSSCTLDGERAARILQKKLSQFALKFAKKGLDRCILLCQVDLLKGLEDMCFLWMQNFFLPFANHPSVTYADIRHTVSSAVLSNLTYLACQTWQQFKMSMEKKERKKGQSNGRFKKLYLVMAVLRQILSQLRRYSEQTLTEEEQKWFLATTETLCCSTNLRQLYPMLIRLFQPQSETTQYLRELIHGNSELLQLISNSHHKHMENGKDVMLHHFTDYVDDEVIRAYTHLLNSFSQNSLEENEAIFTFYYHIVIDLNSIELLFKLHVFSAFANIWEAQSPLVSQESLELMDYIIFKYTELAMESPDDGLHIAKDILEKSKKKQQKGKKRKHVDNEAGTSTKKSKIGVIGYKSSAIAKWSCGDQSPVTSPASAIARWHTQQFDQGPYGESKILNKMLQEGAEIEGLYCVGSCSESDDEELVKEIEPEIIHCTKTAQECLEDLRSKGYSSQIDGLQALLLEVTYVKLNCPKTYPAEPIVWQYCADRKSIPFFAFTLKDKAVQALKVFQSLLQKMRLHQAKDSSHLFPSVPAFMTPEMTYGLAKILGPVEKSMLKFEVSDDMELLPEHLVYAGLSQYTVVGDHDSQGEDDLGQPIMSLRPTHGLRAPGGMWMGLIKKANAQMPNLAKHSSVEKEAVSSSAVWH